MSNKNYTAGLAYYDKVDNCKRCNYIIRPDGVGLYLYKLLLCENCAKIMSVDPGKATGIAMFPEQRSITVNSDKFIKVVNTYKPDVIVYEEFMDYKGVVYDKYKGKKRVYQIRAKDKRHPIEIIGYIKGYSSLHNIPIHNQQPDRRKALKFFNIHTMTKFTPEENHEEDAILHLYVFLYKIKHPNTPIGILGKNAFR